MGIKDLPTHIEIHLYHLKGAIGGRVSNDINNFFFIKNIIILTYSYPNLQKIQNLSKDSE